MRRWPLALIAVVSCSHREPPPPAPPTPPVAVTPDAAAPVTDAAAKQFAAFLAVFNDGNRDQLAKFAETSWAPDEHRPGPDDLLRFRGVTGGFDVVKVEDSQPLRQTALVKERDSDQFARAVIEVEPAPPHRIAKLQVLIVPAPDGLGPKRLPEAEALAALRAELDKRAAADQFAGAVAIAKDGKVIFREARGLADRDAKTANTPDTRFRIGSMNKMFTATATLQLVQAGKLALDAPIGKVLTDYPNQAIATKVTLHHLLTHTGGTGDIFGPEFDAHRLELKTHGDYVKLYGARDPLFAPAERWEYSNYGFLLLGAIIERATKKTYYDRVEAAVFKPAGMTSTSSPIEGTKVAKRSVPYMRDDATGSWKSAADTLPYRGTSAGGGDSTVDDLLRFAAALRAHKLLDTKHTELLTTGKVETRGGGKYAYGFQDSTEGGVRCVGHGGGAPGMNGELAICDSGYTIAVLANLDPPVAGRMLSFIKARLPAP